MTKGIDYTQSTPYAPARTYDPPYFYSFKTSASIILSHSGFQEKAFKFAYQNAIGEDITDLYEYFMSEEGDTLARLSGMNGSQELLFSTLYVAKYVAAVKG